MRNLKRALSLTLASVMLLGMMVVGSSAAGYPDVSEEENIEAIEVLQSVGVMEGDNNGNFNPDDYVTREQMAVIMSKLLNLDYNYYQGTNPFSDVPAWAAPYVAACAANGITSGIGGGMYGAGQNVNAVQAALMMLKALGYFQYQEDFGESYVLATVKQATEVGLFAQIDSRAENPLTRNEVAQMALNALRSDMVTFTGDVGTKIPTANGDVVVGYRAEYTSRTSTLAKYHAIEGRTSDVVGGDNINRGQYYIQLGEELYDGDLRLNNTALDDFGRPSRQWTYKSNDIGTYAKKELLRETYTAKVSGEDLYNLLTRSVINDYDLDVYVDGALVAFDKNQLVRSNTSSIGTTDANIMAYQGVTTGTAAITGNGVKTEVYVDDDAGADGEITVAIINTYLAQANADYSANSETVSMEVYYKVNASNTANKRVDVEDVPAIEGIKENDFVLVNWASDSTEVRTKEVKKVTDVPQVLTDVSVSKFSKNRDDSYATAGQITNDRVTNIITDGTEYKNSFKSYYEYATLGDYNGQLLTDRTYDIYLDQYGYFIGAALHSGDDNYVFISAVDTKVTALGLRNADALGIFADGTMKTINVNVSDTNKNIARVRGEAPYTAVLATNPSYNSTVASDTLYAQWTNLTSEVHRWFTFTEKDGVYVLTPVTRYVVDVAEADEGVSGKITIRSDRLSLYGGNGSPDVGTGRAYGNDDSVYITVDLIKANRENPVVDEVTGVYTGAQSATITYSATASDGSIWPGWISAVYDSKDNVIAAVVHGEAEGATKNYAYILSGAKSEGRDGDDYLWVFKAILGGEIRELTIKSKFTRTVDELQPGIVQQLLFDADGNVSTIRDIPNTTLDNSNRPTNAQLPTVAGGNKVYDNDEYDDGLVVDDFDVFDVYAYSLDANGAHTGLTMDVTGRTMHFNNVSDKRGLGLISTSTPTVLSQQINNDRKEFVYSSTASAFADVVDTDNNTDGKQAHVRVVAVLNSDGVAEWVFIYDYTPVRTGNNPNYGTNNIVGAVNRYIIPYTVVVGNPTPTIDEVRNDIVKALGWTWIRGEDSIEPLNDGNYRITYGGIVYTVQMSDNNAPAGPVAGEEIEGVKQAAEADATADNIKHNLIDGAYVLPSTTTKTDVAADILGKIEDHIIFKFTLLNGTQPASATLIIKDSDGNVVYEETSAAYTPGPGATAAPLNNFFYVKVLDSDNTGVINAGRGDLKRAPLTAGDYTWEVSGANIRTVGDTFTIK